MRPRSAMPALAVPFIVVGASAGWLSAGLLASPLLSVTVRSAQPLAAMAGGLVGAAVGEYLSRRCAPRDDEPRLPVRPLVGSVLLAGALTGAVCGLLAIGWPCYLYNSAAAGLLSAVAFLPICALVVAAARRAARARMGSIVAGADRRAVWAILAACLAATTLAAVPDWPASRSGEVPAPYFELALALVAAGVCLALLGADIAAERRIRAARAAAIDMESRDAIDDSVGSDVPRLDLGIGDDVLARVARAQGAYRGGDRSTALILGSPDEAAGALRIARRRACVGLVPVACAIAAHALAANGGADIAYEEYRCDAGLASSCREAGLLLEAARAGRATVLHQRACQGGVQASCALLLERGAILDYQSSCDRGDVASCRALADRLLRGTDSPPVLRRSCERGDTQSCQALRDMSGCDADGCGIEL